MFRVLIIVGLVFSGISLFAEDIVQSDFSEKFVGYKMDPFVIQESKECLLKPYMPTYGGFDIFSGPFYKKGAKTTNQ